MRRKIIRKKLREHRSTISQKYIITKKELTQPALNQPGTWELKETKGMPFSDFNVQHSVLCNEVLFAQMHL